MQPLLSSLNSEKSLGTALRGVAEAIALNAEGKAPDWVMLWPQGRLVVGRDKRSFVIHDPEAIIAATRPKLPLLVDYEHDFDVRRPGDETPAAGWIEELEVRDGAIWGRVEWTPKAANAIADREYRFHSPVYFYRRDSEPMQVIAIGGAALTHNPNLGFTALNSEQESVMDKELAKALGLSETASVADAIIAVNALSTPALTKYVPRADYDQALDRAKNAEQKLAAFETAQAQNAAEALIDKAIADRKIAPASRDHYLKLAVNSRADVEALLATTPAILPAGEDKGLANGDPAGQAGALSPAEKAMCAAVNITEEAFLKARG
ncbi:MAG: phage protease [Rhabdaerophilum sp.]